MTPLTNSATTNLCAKPEPDEGLTSTLFRIILTVCAVTLIVVAILLSLGIIRLSQTGITVLTAFVYSVTIGMPSAFLLHWLGHRFTDKYPRLIVLVYALTLVCTATVGCLAAGFLFQIFGIVPRDLFWFRFRANLPFCLVITLVIGLAMTAYHTLLYKLQATTIALRTKQVEQERAYKLLAEARLSALESRIHPHFLFNTLNSIAALIPSNPQLAEDTVGKLASLLRFSLNANQSGLVPLSQELKVVRDYLEIEKTRFGARLSYEIAVPEPLQDVKVPPLALQSLVENAVKHVVAQRAQGVAIQVAASKDSNRIRLEVLDDGPGFSLDAITPEHGLGNLIARLELLFGDAGQLEVTRENGKTAVRLSFPA
ncbi:MAG: histidine kinase [Terracidiphilus sp.]|jgi:sensor histidine kinase YesM